MDSFGKISSINLSKLKDCHTMTQCRFLQKLLLEVRMSKIMLPILGGIFVGITILLFEYHTPWFNNNIESEKISESVPIMPEIIKELATSNKKFSICGSHNSFHYFRYIVNF